MARPHEALVLGAVLRQVGTVSGLTLNRGGLSPVAVIHIREDIVPPLDLLEPFRLELALSELLVNPREAQHMVFHALAGILRTCARAENEGPIAGLGKEQFARGLFE